MYGVSIHMLGPPNQCTQIFKLLVEYLTSPKSLYHEDKAITDYVSNMTVYIKAILFQIIQD